MDDFDALCSVAQNWGVPIQQSELKQAFDARQARRLSETMLAAGLLDRKDLPPLPQWNPSVWSRVASLDLDLVARQLMDRMKWTPERTLRAETLYRRFLYLAVALPDLKTIPSEDIDEFWHQHILNTAKYAADCQLINGAFIHHLPATPGVDESTSMGDYFFETWLAYETLFGEPYGETIGSALLNRYPA